MALKANFKAGLALQDLLSQKGQIGCTRCPQYHTRGLKSKIRSIRSMPWTGDLRFKNCKTWRWQNFTWEPPWDCFAWKTLWHCTNDPNAVWCILQMPDIWDGNWKNAHCQRSKRTYINQSPAINLDFEHFLCISQAKAADIFFRGEDVFAFAISNLKDRVLLPCWNARGQNNHTVLKSGVLETRKGTKTIREYKRMMSQHHKNSLLTCSSCQLSSWFAEG